MFHKEFIEPQNSVDLHDLQNRHAPKPRRITKEYIDPSILFVCSKVIEEALFEIVLREYRGSIVIDLSCLKLKVKTSASISFQSFLDKTGRIFIKDSTREELNILTKDEILLKLRLENLAQRVWLQTKNDHKGKTCYQITIQSRPYPDENCLLPVQIETSQQAKERKKKIRELEKKRQENLLRIEKNRLEKLAKQLEDEDDKKVI